MGIEFELKFSCPRPEEIRAAFPGEFSVFSMETTYYDTPDRMLSARRWTLRRRLENGIPVCTLKTPGTDLGREEWECRCERIEDAAPELCKLALPEAPDFLTGLSLRPLCGARFRRQTQWIVTPEFSAELALDQGVLFGGGKELPFSEAELELKAGSREALIAYARDFARRFCLTAERKSKFQRAAALTEGE